MIKRYDFWTDQEGTENKDGNWCKYSEVKELVNKTKHLKNALFEAEMGEDL